VKISLSLKLVSLFLIALFIFAQDLASAQRGGTGARRAREIESPRVRVEYFDRQQSLVRSVVSDMNKRERDELVTKTLASVGAAEGVLDTIQSRPSRGMREMMGYLPKTEFTRRLEFQPELARQLARCLANSYCSCKIGFRDECREAIGEQNESSDYATLLRFRQSGFRIEALEEAHVNKMRSLAEEGALYLGALRLERESSATPAGFIVFIRIIIIVIFVSSVILFFKMLGRGSARTR